MSDWFILLTKGAEHIGEYFMLSAKFWLQESHLSEQFLEGHKQPWNFESKSQKFYIIAF